MLNLFKLKKKNEANINSDAQKKTSKHFPSPVRE